jgi:hypothetical protein
MAKNSKELPTKMSPAARAHAQAQAEAMRKDTAPADVARRTWDYRVVHQRTLQPVPAVANPTLPAEAHTYTVHEVHYEDSKPIAWVARPTAPRGTSPGELRADIEARLAALDQPVLELSAMPGVDMEAVTRKAEGMVELLTKVGTWGFQAFPPIVPEAVPGVTAILREEYLAEEVERDQDPALRRMPAPEIW